MGQGMKKITVSKECAACGICVLMTDLLIENEDGTVSPKEPAFLPEEQYESFLKVIESCPVKAIHITEDEISSSEGTDAVLKLKDMLDNKLKGFVVENPDSKEFDFDEGHYEAPLMANNHISKLTYSSYDKAHREGFSEFKYTMYSQRPAMVQALLISFKIKQLKKFAYYEKEKGNYYHDINTQISKYLSEALAIAQNISRQKLNIPDDFCVFEVGPDCGYDGDGCCWSLRNIEQLEWKRELKEADYFDAYINVDEYGDKYRYNLHEIEKEFKEHVALEISWEMPSRIYDWIDEAVSSYRKAVKDLINKKLVILKAELKKCSDYNQSDADASKMLKSEIQRLLDEYGKSSIQKETVYYDLDHYYDSSFRFTSESQCEEAAENRLTRFYDSCQGYLSVRHSPSISYELSEKYKIQFEKVFNTFKSRLQAIFDKYDTEYPNITITASGGKHGVSMNLSSFDDCSSNIDWDIREYIDNAIIGYGGKVSYYDYFSYSDGKIDIYDCPAWKKGLFGDVEYTKYAYNISFFGIEDGFRKACNDCCEYVFKSDFLNDYYSKLMNSLIAEVNDKVKPDKK